MTLSRFLKSSALISFTAALCIPQICPAQDSSGNQSWTSTDHRGTMGGVVNPSRTNETHTEADGRVVDGTSVETLGPDGRYIPYSDTERVSRRVDDMTVRTVERIYGRDPDGHKTLIREIQEESRSLPSGEQKVTRTVSGPDANGRLQILQRQLEDSKQVSPGVRVTNTTLLSPDINGGFSAAVQTEQRETSGSDGTVESKKSTLLPDGIGGWRLSEVRESTTKPDGQGSTKDERVLRPDSNGKFAIVEHTINKQAETSTGERHDTTETYSTNVPGVASDGSLQLVQRQTTVQRTTSAGAQSTVRQIEQPRPGESSRDLHVTQEAIDIVRPGGSGKADQSHTILTSDPDGHLTQIWVDTGKTDNPSAVKVDTRTSKKPQ